MRILKGCIKHIFPTGSSFSLMFAVKQSAVSVGGIFRSVIVNAYKAVRLKRGNNDILYLLITFSSEQTSRSPPLSSSDVNDKSNPFLDLIILSWSNYVYHKAIHLFSSFESFSNKSFCNCLTGSYSIYDWDILNWGLQSHSGIESIPLKMLNVIDWDNKRESFVLVEERKSCVWEPLVPPLPAL